MNCGEGAIQTRGTCWFYSIINGFLLSTAGQKILFAAMEDFYKSLDPSEKAYFDDEIDAPCPLKGNIQKTKRIYFYKFLDQYLCYKSGRRVMSLRAAKSPNILGGISLVGTIAREHTGTEGAYSQEELPKVLKHLGLTDYLFINTRGGIMWNKGSNKRPHFLIRKAPNHATMPTFNPFSPANYRVMCCGITMGNTTASNYTLHRFHSIAGFLCNDKGYLFDSNQLKIFPCDWWRMNEVKKVVTRDVAPFYPSYKGQTNYFGYTYVIYSSDSYVKNIHPVCRLKRRPNNARPPVPVANSPRTARRKNTVSKFNNYWTKLMKENRNVVRNYIEKRKSPKTPSLKKRLAAKMVQAKTIITSRVRHLLYKPSNTPGTYDGRGAMKTPK